MLGVMKLRETKPMQCLVIERGRHFWVFMVEGRETHILLSHGAEGNEMHKCLVVVKLTERKPM